MKNHFQTMWLLLAVLGCCAPNAFAGFQVIEGAFTWHQAKADAEARGGRLAVLNSQAKIDAANAYLQSRGSWPEVWIGLTDEAQEGTWRWITGDLLGASSWYPDEPNNLNNEDYAQLGKNTFLWNDLPDYSTLPAYLLEIEQVVPTITNQPVSINTTTGAVAQFSVGVSNTTSVSYQWYRDGNALPSATNATYTIADVQPPRIGNYWVVVANGGGSVTSSVASLSISGVNSALWQGLVAYYPFSGNANDESGNANHGTIQGGGTYGSGKVGQAFYLNGMNAYIEVASSPALQPTNAFSAEAWVNYDRITGSGDGAVIVSKGNQASGPTDWALSISTNRKLRPHVYINGSGWWYFDCATTLTTGVWYHVAMVYDGTNITGYVNGMADGSETPGPSTAQASDGTLSIGVHHYGGNLAGYFPGQIDELGIYNRALSSNEVAALYASEAPPIPPRAATATPTLAFGFFVNATITDGGYGYTNPPLVRIVGGGGNGAQATAIVSNGVVVGINVLNPGNGYTNTPQIIIQPPFITPPALGISPYTLLSFSSLTPGGSYQLQSFKGWYWTNEPTSFTASSSIYTQLVVGAPSTKTYRLALSPAPSQAFATPIVSYGFLVAATVTAGGSGYVTPPNIHLMGGGGSNAVAVANLSGGSVASISILNAGFGYTNPPTLQLAPPPAAAIAPQYVPVMRVDAGALSPYDSYQVEFKPEAPGSWQSWGAPFQPPAASHSQYLYITNAAGFFRMRYLP